MSTIDTVNAASAVVSGTGAMIAIVVAGWSIYEGRRLYKLQTSPDVVIYIERDPGFHDAAHLVVTNIGAAPASEVRLIFKENSKLFTLNESRRKEIFIIDYGIRTLMPGQVLSFTIGIFRDMEQDDEWVQVRYFRASDIAKSEPITSNFLLRPRELRGGGKWTDHAEEAHKSVKKAMDSLIKGKISVHVEDPTD